MTLRVTGRDPVAVATELKDTIHERLGFTVNVGVGSNKLLAKMASDFEKPDRVHTLWSEEVPAKMWPLDVRDLLWVGARTEERLTAYGIRTIGTLASTDISTLERIVGRNTAIRLHESAAGIDDSPVETQAQEAKSISAERTFAQDICSAEALDRALFKVACIVAHRLRRSGMHASCVSVFVKYRDFSVAQKQRQTSRPTDVTAEILNEARVLISQAWDGVTPVRQVGLGVSKLTHGSVIQMTLFEDPKLEYWRQWDMEYDERMAAEEDARMLAYERIPAEGTLPQKTRDRARPDTAPLKKTAADRPKDDILEFRYPDGESALRAAKKALRAERGRTFRSEKYEGQDCFVVIGAGGKILERHTVTKQ